MSTSRIVTLEAHPSLVFDSLMGVVEERGLYVHLIDPARWQVVVSIPGKSYRVSASVTDNGYGKSALHMSWEPPGSGGAGKLARRLGKATRRSVAGLAGPPDGG